MSEKKWFIYVGDHHEGPFTVSEIWASIDAGTYHQASFVWADGMKEWTPLVDVPEFDRAPAPNPEPIQPATLSPAEAETIPPIQEPSLVMDVHTAASSGILPPEEASVLASETSAEPESQPAAVSVEKPVTESEAAQPVPVEVETTKTGVTTFVEVKPLEDATRAEMLRPAAVSQDNEFSKPSFLSRAMKPFGFIAGILVGFVGMHKMGLLEGIEGKVISLFSTLPEFPDVEPEDYEKLKNAVRTPLSAAPQVAIALSKADPLSPIFYLATNLPDGARFEIYVEGIGHRLLNTLSFSGKLDVVTSRNFVRSQPLRYPDGKPIPRGEYVVYVMESPENQPDLVYKELLQLAPVARNLPKNLPQERRLVFSKKIFFGSRDATYEQRLKEFHDGLIAKAKGEIFELSQAAVTLESQAMVSMATYDRLKTQFIGPRQKQTWNGMNQTWRPIQAQLVQRYVGMTPEQIKENFFHGNLIAEFIVVEKILSDLHSTQEKLFTTSANARSLQPEIEDLRRQFESRKAIWKDALARAQAHPVDPETGLPVAIRLGAGAVSTEESTPTGTEPEAAAGDGEQNAEDRPETGGSQ